MPPPVSPIQQRRRIRFHVLTPRLAIEIPLQHFQFNIRKGNIQRRLTELRMKFMGDAPQHLIMWQSLRFSALRMKKGEITIGQQDERSWSIASAPAGNSISSGVYQSSK